jgi:hypothetical protein
MDAAMQVGEAIARCSARDLKTSLFACEELLLDYDEYPAELFREWLKLIGSRNFDACTKSWLLLQHLYDNGQLLTEDQKSEFAPLLARKFAAGSEKQSFIIATLLGEICGAVTMLTHLAQQYERSPLGEVLQDALTRLKGRDPRKP